jgi:branched-chain amino acid transport system ATP-binding protein
MSAASAATSPAAASATTAAGQDLLSVEGLTVDYGRIRALHGLSLRIREGELVAVIGSNGAGKTTTLRAISGLLAPTEGRVLFEGKPLVGVAPHDILARGVAHVPEGRKVFAQQSVHDNLLLGAFLRLRRGEKKAVDEDIEKMFATFPRLKERRAQLAGTLSGGEQQMLAIARALVSRPKLLLLDEPSMGLAPVIIDEVFALIERLKAAGGTTILLVEQLAWRALEVADRGYVLEQGRIRLEGTGAQLLKDDGVRRAYLGASHGH